MVRESWRNPPIFLLGSARSGTKIFRDVLDSHPKIKASPYPLEGLWGLDDVQGGHHEYKEDWLTQKKRRNLRQTLRKKDESSTRYLEKNVIHSLRLGFVRKAFPEAQYIHIMRDGRDVVTSLRERWKHPLDWGYYLFSGKALKLSLIDVCSFGFRRLVAILRKYVSNRDRVKSWGPRYKGIDEDLGEQTLLEVCARQWKKSVLKARRDAASFPSAAYHEIKYEDLILNTERVLESLLEFLNLADSGAMKSFAVSNLRRSSIGRWRQDLSDEEASWLNGFLHDELKELGYTPKKESGP